MEKYVINTTKPTVVIECENTIMEKDLTINFSIKEEQSKTITTTENKETITVPDEGKVLRAAVVNTNVGGPAKGYILSDYDENGYPHNGYFVGEWKAIPNKYFSRFFYADTITGKITNIEIPNGVTRIENQAFYYCDSLTSIEIPNSVTSIGYCAFEDCSNLTNVYYSGTIEDWCNITFSDSTSNPMSYAEHFYMLDENKEYKEVTEIEIPNTITKIGNYQFCGFNNVTSITIPNSVTSIGWNALKIGNANNKATITVKSITPPTIQSSTFNSSYLNKIYVPSESVEAYKTATNWVKFADYIEADPNE